MGDVEVRQPARARRLGPLLVAAVVSAIVAVAAVVGWRIADTSASDQPSRDAAELSQAQFQAKTGVRVTLVAVTGGGGLVDLRYQVVDPAKAEVVHLRPPTLVDEDTGRVVDTLFMGHSHGEDPRAGHSYPLLFVNAAGVIDTGDTVSVVIGTTRLRHVPVS